MRDRSVRLVSAPWSLTMATATVNMRDSDGIDATKIGTVAIDSPPRLSDEHTAFRTQGVLRTYLISSNGLIADGL